MRILLVTGRYPWPTRRGDQLRAVQTVAALQQQHEVTLLTPAPPPGAPEPKWPDDVGAGLAVRIATYSAGASPLAGLSSLVAGRPLQTALFARVALAARVRALARDHDLVLLQLLRLEGALDALERSQPVLVDFIDSLSLHFSRRAAIDRPLLRPFWRFEAARLARAEARLLGRSVASWAIARRDVEALGERSPERPPTLVRLAVQSNDEATGPEPAAGNDSRRSVGFTGNLAYFPNHDAVNWFARHAWPALHAVRPDIEFVVAGHRPGRAISRMARSAGVRLVTSPPDLRGIVRATDVLVAPVRCGAGVPVKVLEAWGEGRPIVVSPWAARGTDGVSGEHFSVADTGEQWAQEICALLDDSERAAAMARDGRRLLERLHAPRAVRESILASIASL